MLLKLNINLQKGYKREHLMPTAQQYGLKNFNFIAK